MRMQGPPPPYHQTQRSSSVPGSMTSPGPGSPSNPTMGMSMPSPRATSGLNSPADGQQQRGGYQQQRMSSGPSPSSSSNHLNTPLDSPNPNGGRSMQNPSNPGTPLAGPGPPHVSPGMGNLMPAGQPQPGK